MKVCIAIDSYKGSITSVEAGLAAKKGILRAIPDAEVSVFPLADGGEGTMEALTEGMGGIVANTTVSDPLGRDIEVHYGIVNNTTAVMEMAVCAGLPLLSKSERNPLKTTTYGVGQMINDALNRGCNKFIIGIGGSSTNDAGIGMLSALGVKFLDDEGNTVEPTAEGVSRIVKIDTGSMRPELKNCDFCVACDVNNPLYGENGCSYVFGPQKGASLEDVKLMDASLQKFAELVKEIIPDVNPDYPGSGAAGGLGFGLKYFLGAKLVPGVSLILKETGIENAIKDADIVVTGEGRIDAQTVMGKAPAGVANIAKKYNKEVLAFAGCISDDANLCNENGIDAIFCIQRSAISLEEAMNKETAFSNMEKTVEQVFRLFQCQYRH